jgi:hypothetical protein
MKGCQARVEDRGLARPSSYLALAAAKRAEIQADIDRRDKAQVASPLSEAALRRIIGEPRLGKPVADLHGSRRGGSGHLSARYRVGTLEWRIWLNPEGRVDYFNYRAVSPSR